MADDRPRHDASPPLACSLDAAALAARRADLAALAARALRGVERTRDVVQLRYARDAAEAVSAAIDLERACCVFLDFAVEVGSADVRVTVRGPQAVLDAMIATLTGT